MVIIFILINYGATILQTLLDASLSNRLPDIFSSCNTEKLGTDGSGNEACIYIITG